MNEVQKQNNKVYLMGSVESEPVYSHELYGEGFFDFKLRVPRLSGQYDILPITVSERLLVDANLKCGTEIGVSGQFRSYNKMQDEKSRLMLTVFVREFLPFDSEEQCPNIVEINGYICKPPIYRTTPFDRKICDMLIAVNRSYNKSDYIPCIAWGRNAGFVKTIPVGKNIVVTGRIQSRLYNKKIDENTIEERTAYELSINKIYFASDLEETASTIDLQ